MPMKYWNVGCLGMLLGVTAAAACNGVITGSGDNGAPSPAGGNGNAGSGGGPSVPRVDGLFTCDPGAPTATPKRIWRLSPLQYRNTVATLFSGRGNLQMAAKRSAPFDDATTVDRFSTFARAHLVNDLAFGRVLTSSANIATEYLNHLKAQDRGCVGQADFVACASGVMKDAGQKLFRRPLEAVEVEQYEKLLADGRALLGDEQGLALVIESMLSAPQFLYRVELGAGQPDGSGRLRLSPFETAAAIAYSLTDAPPDEALWKAAQANALETEGDIRSHVERLIATPGHAAAVMRFLKEYFGYGAARDVFKDEKQFPFHDAALLVDDTDRWLSDVYQRSGREGFLQQLLTFDEVIARGRTATNYNLLADMAADAPPKLLRAPAGQRVGILTQPSFLTALSHSESTDPVRRGRYVAESLLCGDIPDLPIGLVPELPEPTAESTLRDRLKQHVEDESCNACHKLMDPIGLGFEGYDHVGRMREVEGGKPVNTQGVLVGADPEQSFTGVAELAANLSQSRLVSQCFVRHGFTYWLGRDTQNPDGCALQNLHKTFIESGQDHATFLAALFASESFLLRRQ